jgi:phosphocarrier protein FPr
MVGLVLVSHNKKLATGVQEMVWEMAGRDFPVAVAAGAGDDHQGLGTDAVHISKVLQQFCERDGAVVLMDFGSAVLSAGMALELLDPACRGRVRLCPAPLVEGAIAAAVQARAGGSLDAVCQEGLRGLAPKQEQLEPETLSLAPSQPTVAPASGLGCELVLTIENEHGLHARPAALLVQTGSRFSSEIEITNETAGRGPAPVRSLTSVALLQVRKGDRIRVRARGVDATAAVQAISGLATTRFGEAASQSSSLAANRCPEFPPVLPISQSALEAVSRPTVIRGIPASEGIGVGRLLPLEKSLLARPKDEPIGEPATEFARLTSAILSVRQRLLQRGGLPGAGAIGEASKIFAAQAFMLDDPVVIEGVKSLLERRHLSATQAWSEVTDGLVGSYRSLDDPYLRERASDAADIARLVLQEVAGQQPPASIRPEPPAILFARELLPSEAATCDPETVLGVITSEGSPTTHSAIMLRTLGIPMVTGVRGPKQGTAVSAMVAMDGGTGEVWLEPSEQILESLERRRTEWRARRGAAEALASQPCVTWDGERIEVLANVVNPADAVLAAGNGAEGVGVLRSELVFLSRSEAPTEAEQENALRAILTPIPPTHRVVIRTLDAGADKPLPFLPQPEEHNPYLGIRGIRLVLQYPEFFLTHLKAILLAGLGRNLGVMFPMISEVPEAERACKLLAQAHAQLEGQGRPHAWPVRVGVMVEVPSAALMAERLADSVDFLSIGTNDLTQYALGAERGNTLLSEFQDALHPAVLRLIKGVVEAARIRGRHVSVCGDAASDPVAAAVFVGLGIRSLSVRPNQVPEIKACFRRLRGSELAPLATLALEARNATEARGLAEEFLREGVIR